jgi:ABC-type methionine transport system permease subunit
MDGAIMMGDGYYGVSDEFIMFVVVPCLIGLVCLVKKMGDKWDI